MGNCNFILPLVTPKLDYDLKYAAGSFPKGEETCFGLEKPSSFFPLSCPHTAQERLSVSK